MNLKKLVEETNVCSLPWIHTEISLQNNSVYPCCKYVGSVGTTDNIKDVWFGEKFQQLRTDLLNGKKVDGCAACDVPKEIFSYKSWKNKFYMPILHEVDTDTIQLPKMWHFTLKNTCNLACRMCWPKSSSLIAQFSSKSKILNKFIPVNDVKINNKTDIERFRGSFSELTSLVITGGEPMLDDDCVTLVRMVREEAKNPKLINFSSNMSIVNIELLDELSKFDCFTSIGVSVDGSPSVHNYVRHRSDFEQLKQNVEFIVKNYPKIKLGFHTSISALTVGYLPELLESVNKMQTDIGFNFNHCMVSSVINRPEIHASVLPDNIKQQYIKKLQSAINPLTVKDSDLVLSTGIHMLSEAPTGTIEDFVEFTNEFDRIANTNVLDVYPEFADIFNK